MSKAKDGDKIKVAGLILVRQRPGTAKGICFITIEDETDGGDLIIVVNNTPLNLALDESLNMIDDTNLVLSANTFNIYNL